MERRQHFLRPPARNLDESTKHALLAMKTRLEAGHPVQISDQELLQWFIYTDAAYNMEEQTLLTSLRGFLSIRC
eukprot:g19410.t1